MKGRFVVVGSMAVVWMVVAGSVRAVRADPTGYRCDRPNLQAKRCDCPAGEISALNSSNEAVCRKRPPPRPRCPSDMVFVGGGTFSMGSPDGVGDADEHPAPKGERIVTLSAYCIDKTEVTVAAYEQCKTCPSAAKTVEWDNLSAEHRKAWNQGEVCNGSRTDRQAHPINCVTWSEADGYCRAAGKRLPTEAQWELAARGTDGRTYPWGGKSPTEKRLNVCGSECRDFMNSLRFDWPPMFDASDAFPTTAPVGSYPDGASPFGALDMAGNVWEWVADEHGPYVVDRITDPSPVKTIAVLADKYFVVRGGGWYHVDPSIVRVANRARLRSSVRGHDNGFRCVRDPQ